MCNSKYYFNAKGIKLIVFFLHFLLIQCVKVPFTLIVKQISQQHGLAKGKYHSYKVICPHLKIGEPGNIFFRENQNLTLSPSNVNVKRQRPANNNFLISNLSGAIGLIAYTA